MSAIAGLDTVHWLYYSAPTLLVPFTADDAFASVLAEIPLTAAGIFGIGVFTIFVYATIVDRLSFTIFTSVLLALIAMIFDLAQLLARGHISNPAGGDVGLVRGLVIVREVALSLSLAVRYVFFALFMVRRPRFANALLGGNPYSWKHFGVAGTVFQWGLFMVIAVLLGMQAVWRLSEGSARTGPVYYASAGIEIGLCVVVIFKMAWNVFVSPKSARLPLLRHYVVPIIAFLFGLAISIGNLAYHLFSETVLGRFLQGVLYYFLIIFLLADAYVKEQPSPRISKEPPVLPVALNRGSTLRLNLPTFSASATPPMPELRLSDHQTVNLSRHSDLRGSMLSRSTLASWIGVRRISRSHVPYYADDERLWTQDQAERGASPVMTEKQANRISEETPSIMEPETKLPWAEPITTGVLRQGPEQVRDDQASDDMPPFAVSVVNTPTGAESDFQKSRSSLVLVPPTPLAMAALSRPTSSTIEWRVPVQSPESETLPLQSHSLDPSYLDLTDINLPPRAFSPGALDSPVYGLNGVRSRLPNHGAATNGYMFGQEQGRQSFLRISSASSMMTDMDIDEVLLRQQELDRSIKKLTILSSPIPSHPQTDSNSASSGPAYPSGFSTSEVSLDQFPPPPTRFDLSQPMPMGNESLSSIDSLLIPPRMLAANSHTRQFSVPASVSETMVSSPTIRSPKFDSKGTEYEITSFIGGLSTQPTNHTPSTSDTRSIPVIQIAISRPTIPKASGTSSMRYIRPEEAPLGSHGRTSTHGRGSNSREAPTTSPPRGPRGPTGISRGDGLPSHAGTLRKEMIGSPRPLSGNASNQARAFEEPRRAPIAPQ